MRVHAGVGMETRGGDGRMLTGSVRVKGLSDHSVTVSFLLFFCGLSIIIVVILMIILEMCASLMMF